MSKQWQNPSLCCKKIRLLSSRNPFYARELAFFPIHLLLSPLSMITLHLIQGGASEARPCLIPQAVLIYHKVYNVPKSAIFGFPSPGKLLSKYILERFDPSNILRPKSNFPFFTINYFFLWKICSIESRKSFSAFCQW